MPSRCSATEQKSFHSLQERTLYMLRSILLLLQLYWHYDMALLRINAMKKCKKKKKLERCQFLASSVLLTREITPGKIVSPIKLLAPASVAFVYLSQRSKVYYSLGHVLGMQGVSVCADVRVGVRFSLEQLFRMPKVPGSMYGLSH